MRSLSVEVRFKVRRRAVERPCSCGSGGGIYKALCSLFKEYELDFCMKCYSVTLRDNRGLDRQGSKKPTFEELANSYGLRSADAAEDIYNKAVGKMRGMLG